MRKEITKDINNGMIFSIHGLKELINEDGSVLVKKRDQWNSIESPEMSIHKYSQLIFFLQRCKVNLMEKGGFFQ